MYIKLYNMYMHFYLFNTGVVFIICVICSTVSPIRSYFELLKEKANNL